MPDLRTLLDKHRRLVAGLMSGTSLDGVDAVLATLEGSGREMTMQVHGTHFEPYPQALRALLLQNSAPGTSSVRELSGLNFRLAELYARAVRGVVESSGFTLADLDLVGSHGQTVHHIPVPEDCAGASVLSTLQIGDPSVLAKKLGIAVVGDFRVGDMALGGQGAPLVPYFDFIRFADRHETRLLLNLGGIANVTVLPRGAEAGQVYAFDTGPANMVIDRLTQRLFGMAFDADGALAAQGRVDEALLARLLDDPYLQLAPPKSTGREKYDERFVGALIDGAGLRDGDPSPAAHDLLATATAFTAHSIHDAYSRFIQPQHPADVLIASGGGQHNRALMGTLTTLFAPVEVRGIEHYGVEGDAKEALCFAVLAHEALNGVPTNLPRVTGASAATVLGKICL